MIKNILVALDDTKASEAARDCALHFAKKFHSKISAIGIVDEPWITSPEAIPIGGSAFKIEIDVQILQASRRRIHQLEKQFKEYCSSKGFGCQILDVEGIPVVEIEKVLIPFDLIFIGNEHGSHTHTPSAGKVSLRQLIKDNPRPLIITGSELPYQENPQVLVAFDGTFASSRALFMALQMGLLPQTKTHIISIDKAKEIADLNADMAMTLCKNHDITPTRHSIQSSDHPSQVILELANDIKPHLIVMGAFGHQGIMKNFMGSCTKEMLQNHQIPLFIYH